MLQLFCYCMLGPSCGLDPLLHGTPASSTSTHVPTVHHPRCQTVSVTLFKLGDIKWIWIFAGLCCYSTGIHGDVVQYYSVLSLRLLCFF